MHSITQCVTVRRPELVAGALRHPHDERHLDLAAEHVADRRGMVDRRRIVRRTTDGLGGTLDALLPKK